ncbi:hypothetical protein BH23ACT9_BH23ACT9_02200 [soil metagenome]
MRRRSRICLMVLILIVTLVPAVPVGAVTFSTGFETFPDGSPIPSGTVIRNEFADETGVRFPNGVVVSTCGAGSACDNPAPQGTKAATSQAATEFSRQRFVMTFDAPQRQVAFTVDGTSIADGTRIELSAIALDSSGLSVDFEQQTFQDASPTRVTLQPASSADPQDVITRVEVYSNLEGSSAETNFIAVDALSFTTEAASGGPSDTTPPVFERMVLSQSGDDLMGSVRVVDDGALATVAVQIVRPNGEFGSTFATGFLCGGTTTPCDGGVYDRTDTLEAPIQQSGEYRVRWQACDTFDNCSNTLDERLTVTAPTPPSTVAGTRLIGLEVNQGVQGRPQVDNGLSDGTVRYSSTVPLVQRKAMLLRGYWGTTGTGGRAAPTLRVQIETTGDYPDQNLFLRMSDTGQADVAIPTVAADRSDWFSTILSQRIDPAATGNYVIPAPYLFLAERIVVEDRWIVEMDQMAQVVLSPVGIIDTTLTMGATVTPAQVQAEITPYLDSVIPATVTLRSPQLMVWRGRSFWERTTGKNQCQSVLRSLFWAYGGRDNPLYNGPRSQNTRFVSAAFVRTIDGCAGIASRPSHPFRDRRRFGGIMVSQMTGDVAGQELLHTMGLIHASNAHNEASGGDAEASWPYDHGAMSPNGYENFGAYLTPLEGERDFRFGVTSVDPCPGAAPAQRLVSAPVCDRLVRGEDSYRHDLMSYATGPAIPGVNGAAWTSDITYRRAYSALVDQTIDPAVGSFTQSGDTGVIQGLLISGSLVPATGEVGLEAVLTRPVDGAAATVPDVPASDDTVLIELLSGDGSVLGSRRAPTSSTGHAEDALFMEAMPLVEGVQTVRVSSATSTDQRTASPSVPTVTIDPPTVDDTQIQLTWAVSDGDGDPIEQLVSLSVDGGASWTGLAVIPDGEPGELTIDRAQLPTGRDVVVAIRASDGFTTTTRTVALGRGVQRIAGSNLRASAVEACQAVAPNLARTVLLARDDVFADALAGAPLAADDSCILFTEGGPDGALDPAVRAEIQRVLLPGSSVRILGGDQAVSAGVAEELGLAGFVVERFFGPSRFETAVAIARQVRLEHPDNDEVLLAYGLNWPDAVMAGAYGAASGTPILLTDTATLHPASAAAMTELGVQRTHVIGGTAVISETAAGASPSPQRVAGPNRMATAAAVATQLWPGVPATGNRAILANVEVEDGWVLALAAAPLAAVTGAPELGLGNDRYPTETRAIIQGLNSTAGPIEIVVIGDEARVAEGRLNEIAADIP